MVSREYTAQEMRETAEGLVDSCVADFISILVGHGNLKAVKGAQIVDMLRQAAEMRERCDKLIAKYSTMPCKQCIDGAVEPDCPYYGEPNGCNSPTYRKFRAERISELNYILRGDAIESELEALAREGGAE